MGCRMSNINIQSSSPLKLNLFECWLHRCDGQIVLCSFCRPGICSSCLTVPTRDLPLVIWKQMHRWYASSSKGALSFLLPNPSPKTLVSTVSDTSWYQSLQHPHFHCFVMCMPKLIICDFQIILQVFYFTHLPTLLLCFWYSSLRIPRTRLSTVGSHTFSVFGPSTLNDLPLPFEQKPSVDSFKSNFKTVLFPKL